LPSKPKARNELIDLVVRHGLEPFLATTRVLVILLDPNGEVITSNQAFEALKQGLPGARALREFLAPSAQPEFDRSFRALGRERKAGQAQLDFGPENQPGRYDCLFVPLGDGRLLLFGERVFTALDLPEKQQRLLESHERVRAELEKVKRTLGNKETELQAVLVQADEVSHTDLLTTLPNRRQIVADLQDQVIFSERNGKPLTISMVDLDHFKLVNDTYGHPTGDDVLRAVAVQLRDHIRLPDLIGRYGGEEFLILLPNGTLKAATEQAGRLCQQIRSAPIFSGQHAIPMTVSIGIAQFKPGEEDWRQLLDRADKALYQAKASGRDQWAIMQA
jgi:diguanylate cyclase (GGDEF)-like protein